MKTRNKYLSYSSVLAASFAWRSVISALVLCCVASSMNGENWEGAELEITKVDEPPAKIFRSVSVAYSATRHGCRAAALVGNIIDGFVVR
ncbi:MAG: hypothetical protein ABF370_21650, partial [Verrucomicrobiales bacterium]